jgi:hypothetical protein
MARLSGCGLCSPGWPILAISARVGLLNFATMPANLKRYYGHGDLHFITNACYARLPLLNSVHARNTFVQLLGEVRDAYAFLLAGYVVFPNHIHAPSPVGAAHFSPGRKPWVRAPALPFPQMF